MKCKLLLCEYARITDNESRFDAIGCGLSKIIIKDLSYPVSFAILMETKMTKSELEKDHSFEINIKDSENKNVALPIKGGFSASVDRSGTFYSVINVQFLIKKEDELTFSLLMNDEEKDVTKVIIKAGESTSIN
jgi:hypothetical protein